MIIVLLSLSLNVLLVGIVFLVFRRRINRILEGGELIDTIKDEINHLVVELNQTTERNIGLIEERIGRLQKLVGDADRKIMLLGKESEKVKFGAEVYDRLKKAAPIVHPAAPPKNSFGDDREQRGDPDKAVVPDPERTTAEEVLELHRQGFDSRIIATRTGSNVGEIELIISLSNRDK
jgi:hypothetical protein